METGWPNEDGYFTINGYKIKLFEAVLDGAQSINGFRNKDLRKQLFGNAKPAKENKKMRSKITRIIRKLRAHRLISKIPRSTRYKVTETCPRENGERISYFRRIS